MAEFVQLVEFQASDIEAVQVALEQFRDENPGMFTFSVSTLTEDRDRPGTYISIVQFPSYERAMEQSDRVSEFAGRLSQLMTGPPTFRNLDVRSALTSSLPATLGRPLARLHVAGDRRDLTELGYRRGHKGARGTGP